MASRGGSYTLFADHRWASPKQPKAKLIFVLLRHKCELSLEMPLGSPPRVRAEEAVLGQQCFGDPTHTLVLSYYTWFTVKGPLLPLHGAVIFEQSEVCPSAGTLSHQSQPTQELVLLRCFCSYCCKVVLSQTKYTVQGKESTVIQLTVGNPLAVLFTDNILYWEIKGDHGKLL